LILAILGKVLADFADGFYADYSKPKMLPPKNCHSHESGKLSRLPNKQ